MNVFINAISIHGGGALVVLLRLLEEMSNSEPHAIWYVAAHPHILSRISDSNNIVKLPFSWPNKSPLHLLYWYEIKLPKLLRQFKADICFSQTNYLPNRKLSCPTLLLVQHAGHFSEEYNQLFFGLNKGIRYIAWKQKTKWVHRSIKRATVVTVQTNDLAERIVDKVEGSHEKIVVIPHGPGLLQIGVPKVTSIRMNKMWRVGYVTKYGVQKDFATAFKALGLLKSTGISIKLILTLNEKNKEFNLIRNQIKSDGIEEIIENHGEISDVDELRKLYDSLDIFIFPSLCESFGFTLVEAMSVGLPVVAADTNSNREIIAEAGNVFQAKSETQLADKIHDIICREEFYTVLSNRSIDRAKEFCWGKTSENMLNLMYQML